MTAPPNAREYLKLEDQMAALSPMEAIAAGISITCMIAGSIGMPRKQFLAFVAAMFDKTAPLMERGEHWLVQSRRSEH